MDWDCDILVVGGGITGMSAAVTATHAGAQTLLVEKRGELGGILRAGLNFPVCGLFGSDGELLNDGLSREMFESINVAPERMGRVWVWPCPSDQLLALFDERIAAEKQLTVLKNCAVKTVEEQDGRIVTVTAGDSIFHPEAVIDCSGDGAVIQLSSAETLMPDKGALAGYSLFFQGLENADGMLPVQVPYVLRKSDLPDYLRFTTFSFPGYLKLSVPADVSDEQLQRDVDAVLQCLEKELPDFGNAVLMETSPYLMQREGVRLKGGYVLTKEDVLSGAKCDAAAVKGAWPVEYWDAKKGQQLEYLLDGEFYEIPFRCLKSPSIGNLLVAGRCISATSEALASTRVMGTCIALGEAAGFAAMDMCV